MKISARGKIISVGHGTITIDFGEDYPNLSTIEIPANMDEERAAGARLYSDVTIAIEIPDE